MAIIIKRQRTYNDFLLECELYKYSDEYFNLVKEANELTLMEMYLNNIAFANYNKDYLIDIEYPLMESLFFEDDNQQNNNQQQNQNSQQTQQNLNQKKEGFFKKIINFFVKLFNGVVNWFKKAGPKIVEAAKNNNQEYANTIAYFRNNTNVQNDQKQKIIECINNSLSGDNHIGTLIKICNSNRSTHDLDNFETKIGNVQDVISNLFNDSYVIKIIPASRAQHDLSKTILMPEQVKKILDNWLIPVLNGTYEKAALTNNNSYAKMIDDSLMKGNTNWLSWLTGANTLVPAEIHFETNKFNEDLEMLIQAYSTCNKLANEFNPENAPMFSGNKYKKVVEATRLLQAGCINMIKVYKEITQFNANLIKNLSQLDFIKNSNTNANNNQQQNQNSNS